jgi:hypothetical protein
VRVERTGDSRGGPPAGFEVEARSGREAERQRGREPAAEIRVERREPYSGGAKNYQT